MTLYTWKDVERKLLLERDKWLDVIVDVEIYTDEAVIHLKQKEMEETASKILKDMLGKTYDSGRQRILLDLEGESLSVVFMIDEGVERESVTIPLFRNVLYQNTAYYSELIEKDLPGVPVIAFHSYKGGVGRTLSLLAFVKAWSELKDLKNPQKLLIVDADIEAPGITWLTMGQEEAAFSFLDLLEVTQVKDNVDEILELVSRRVSELTIKIETEKGIVEHIALPTYRYVEQLLDMYSSPESLALSYNKKYILAEVLSKLGEKVDAELVLIDLRAGLSEFSAPVLFDPRVKKYLVTSTSYQSIKGTEILLQQLSKGLPLDENSVIPEILITMVQKGMNTAEIVSEIVAVYDQYMTEDNTSITDNAVTELPFASELIHLDTLSKIMENLNGRDFYKKIYEIIDQTLNRLWGVKLGKPISNEANSSRWILAALSDFNGQLQARDIIRFLEKATDNVGKPVYEDRYLMPTEIRRAVSECSTDKIGEIKDEIKALEPIFDKLENAPEESKVLPFSSDTFNLTQAEEKIMKQEGYLKIDNDRYYLPEIIRHALKFKYGKGARPKVLSLLFK
mgnify:CR=1 FL=1